MSTMSSNIFAALQKPSKKLSLKGDAPVETKAKKHAELEKAIFSAPAAAVSNWADDSDEDWEAPSRGVSEHEDGWNQARLVASRNSHMRLADLQLDETDEAQEEDALDPEVDIHIDIEAELGIELPPSSDDEELEDESGDEMNEVEGDMHAPASDLESTERAQNKNNSTTNSQQLSKKQREELKKKELEQLDEVLAELGIAPESKESADDKLIASSKAAKRKARKARQQETNMGNHHLEIKSEGSGQSTEPEQPAVGLTTSTNGIESVHSGPAVDFEAVKAAKLAIARKKSSGSKKAGAAAAAAAAAAEAKKTKKANNKDKTKYNEMPTR